MGIWPLLMRWALTTMWLCAAWRKTSVSRATGSTRLSRMSRSTLPAPTLGSWSASPTSTRRVPGRTALSSERMSSRSTMDISSTMTTSAFRGSSSVLPKSGASSSSPAAYSSRRWMVLASWPVASVMRLAARPVGAARETVRPAPCIRRMMQLMTVVLPVPGPPVMTTTGDSAAMRMAARWPASKRMSWSRSKASRSASSADTRFFCGARCSSRSWSATSFSASSMERW